MDNPSNENLKFLFWNSRSIVNKKEELQKIAENLDIFVCVESWLTDKTPAAKNFHISGFKTFRKDRETSSQGGGILALIRNNLAFVELPNINCSDKLVELAGFKITNVHPSLNIVICYRPPDYTLSQAVWDEIFKNTNTSEPIIFMGDFNSHHMFWNCQKNDTDGERLLSSLIDSNLILHNTKTITRTQFNSSTNSTTNSNIDLIFSSPNITDKITFKINKDTWGSDHFPIFIDIQLKKNIYRKKTFKINSVRTDWDNVYVNLDKNYQKFLSFEYNKCTAREKYTIFTEIISNAITLNTPKRKDVNNKIHRNPVPWWDSECDKIRRLRSAAFQKYQFSNNINDFINFKKLRAQAKKTFKKKKKDYVVEFASNINFFSNPKYVWNVSKILKNKWNKITPSHTSENHRTENQIETALNKISPAWAGSDPDWLPRCNDNDFLNNIFNFSEFLIALNSKNSRSTPGLDGINYECIKLLPIKYKLLLLDIFNEMYTTNSYPSQWKQSYIHFISKSDGVSVRPISLTSCMCKLLETIIKNKLEYWVERNNVLPKSQSGFRKGQSTMDNLTNLTLNIEDSFSNNKDVLAAFLDVSGAFDNVNLEILLEKLAQIGCPVNLVQFIKFITFERLIHSQNIKNNPRKVYKGVPQGGVLSPLLYNIYVSKITENLPKSVIVSQFADDIAIYSKRYSTNRNKKLLEKSIQVIQNNLSDLGLDLAPHKTIFIHFNKKNIKPGQTEIQINNMVIPSSESVRFLGIIFDYKFSFKHQIDHIQRKSLRSLNLIKFLRGTWWGCNPDTLLILYKSFVRSTLEYGCFIFFPTQKTQIEKIERIQYAAIRYSFGYRISTPVNVLLSESKLDPLQERSKYLGINYINKIYSNKNLLVHETLSNFSKNFNKQSTTRKYSNRLLIQCIQIASPMFPEIISRNHYNNFSYDYNILTYTINTNIEFGKSLKKSKDPNKKITELLTNHKAYAIYTDGSKITNSQSVGSACVVNDLESYSTKSLTKNASIFTAECIALNQAIEHALTTPNKNAIIFTDSLSAITSLINLKINIQSNPYILEFKKKVFEFTKKTTKGSSIELFWVPAHSGICGNESADTLAKSATEVKTSSALKIPFTDLKEQTKCIIKNNTRKFITEENASKGTEYITYFHNNTTKPWFYKKKLPRKIITTINRCRSGHYSLASSLAKIGLASNSKCECGNELQDINHIFWQCPLYNQQRHDFVTNLNHMYIFLPNSCSSLLYKPTSKLCKLIYSFTVKCGIQL